MRTRLKDYTVHTSYTLGETTINNCIVFDNDVITSIEDIRLIVNETQRVVISSSMKKSGVSTDGVKSITPILDTKTSNQVGTVIGINTSVCTLVTTDKLTIEVDKGISISNLEKAAQETTPFGLENTLNDETNGLVAIKSATDNVSNKIGVSIDSDGDNDTVQKKLRYIIGLDEELPSIIKGGQEPTYKAETLPAIILSDNTCKKVVVTYNTITDAYVIQIGAESTQISNAKVGDIIRTDKAGYYLSGTTITQTDDGLLSGATQILFEEGAALKVTGFIDITDSSSTVIGKAVSYEPISIGRDIEETYRIINRKLGEFEEEQSVETLLADMSQAYTEHKRLIVEALNTLNIEAKESDSWVQLAAYISNIELTAEPMTEEQVTNIFNSVINPVE